MQCSGVRVNSEDCNVLQFGLFSSRLCLFGLGSISGAACVVAESRDPPELWGAVVVRWDTVSGGHVLQCFVLLILIFLSVINEVRQFVSMFSISSAHTWKLNTCYKGELRWYEIWTLPEVLIFFFLYSCSSLVLQISFPGVYFSCHDY